MVTDCLAVLARRVGRNCRLGSVGDRGFRGFQGRSPDGRLGRVGLPAKKTLEFARDFVGSPLWKPTSCGTLVGSDDQEIASRSLPTSIFVG